MKKLYFLLLTLLITMSSFSQVFITEIADPNNNANARYIELYNAGGTPVDFTEGSGWQIDKYTNASATVSETLDLTGTIPAGGFYIIAYDLTAGTFNTVYGFAPDQLDAVSNGVAGSNGDDDLFLIDGTDAIVDAYGTTGVDNSTTCAEYEDGRAERKPGTTIGVTTWDESQWNVWADSASSDTCTSYVVATQDAPDDFDPGTWIGTATSPTITVGAAVSGLDYFEGNGPSAEGSFSVDGFNLTADVLVSAPSTDFELSLTSGGTFTPTVTVTQTAGSASTTVYVRLAAGLTANTYSGDATASSTGATDALVSLSGTVSPAVPQISVFGTINSLDYTDGAGPSPEDTFTVEGLFLTADIVVTAPSTDFEVSLTSGSGFASSVSVTPDGSGTVATTTIYVRLVDGLAVGPYSGDITISSTGVTDEVVALTGNVFGPPTNALVLTGVFDGPLTGGVPKGVEIYVLSDIADLSLFGIGSANNGGGTDGQEFTFTGSATAGSYIYVSNDALGFSDFFGFTADFVDSSMGINGDDAVELFENGQVIDTFGDINAVPGTWNYLDGWAYRNDDTGPDGGTFVEANWTFSGIDVFDGQTTNATATTPFPIGTYGNTLSVDSFTVSNFSLYPNPTNTGFVNITTTSSEKVNVNVFDILGKKVISQTLNNNTLNVSDLNSGVYIVKLTQNGASTTKKLVIE